MTRHSPSPRRFFVFFALAWAFFALAAPAFAGEQLLVLPLQPDSPRAYDLGPAIQNVLENMVAQNPAFEETYLIAHSRALFASAGELDAYMRGNLPPRFAQDAAKSDGVRFLLGGRLAGDAKADLWLIDLVSGNTAQVTVPLDVNAGLTAFRREAVAFLDRATGLPFPPGQAAKALKPMTISLAALKTYGRSYGSYQVLTRAGGKPALDLDLALRAVKEAPGYLTANMAAWQLSVMGEHARARALYEAALDADPDGVDALDGMMLLAAQSGGQDAAFPWALRKAKARGEGIGPALALMHDALGGNLMAAKLYGQAAAHYSEAQDLDPDAVHCVYLAQALSAMGRHQKAVDALDARLARPASPTVQALLLNAKAFHLYLESVAYRNAKDAAGEERSLEKALATLTASPYPLARNKWLYGFELARNLQETGNPAKAAEVLRGLSPTDDLARLWTSAALLSCRADAGEDPEDARATLRRYVRGMAERDRVGDPVPPGVLRALAAASEKLGDKDMASSLTRQADARKPDQSGRAGTTGAKTTEQSGGQSGEKADEKSGSSQKAAPVVNATKQ